MAISKKDFEAIAQELAAVMPKSDEYDGNEFFEVHRTWESCVHAVERSLKARNPRFDIDLFRDTCGYND